MVFSFNNRSIIILRYAVILLLLINCYAIGQTQYTSQEFQIPDNTTGVTVGTINITDSGTLKDIHVKVNYNSTTGTNAAEFITLSIISPSGTVVELAKGANITSGNLRGSTLYETMFDDNATTSITSGSQPYTGTYKPIGQFSTLLNESITGQWRLVVNQTSNYSGTFNFSLFITTQADIKYIGEYANDTNTVLLMHLNESNGSNIKDYSSNNYTVNKSGSTTTSSAKFNNGRNYPSPSIGYLSIPANSKLNPINSFTVETWVRFQYKDYSSNGGQAPVLFSTISLSGQGGYALGLYPLSPPINPYALYFAVKTNTGIFLINSKTEIEALRWYHVAGVYQYDGVNSKIKIAVNGVFEDSLLIPNARILNTGTSTNVIIGNQEDRLDAYRQFWGILDEIRFSDKARTAKEFNLQLPPKNLQTNLSGNQVNLSWLNGGGSIGLLRYRIYRGTDSSNVALIDSTNLASINNSGLSTGVKYFYRVSAIDSTGFEGVKSSAVSVTVQPGTPCPGTPTVTYAGKTYNTVQIGNQCWLKENLDVGTMIQGSQNQTNNSMIEKFCYDNNPNNC